MVGVSPVGRYRREYQKYTSVILAGFCLTRAPEKRGEALGGVGQTEKRRLSRLLFVEEGGTCSRSAPVWQALRPGAAGG